MQIDWFTIRTLFIKYLTSKFKRSYLNKFQHKKWFTIFYVLVPNTDFQLFKFFLISCIIQKDIKVQTFEVKETKFGFIRMGPKLVELISKRFVSNEIQKVLRIDSEWFENRFCNGSDLLGLNCNPKFSPVFPVHRHFYLLHLVPRDKNP